VLLLFLRGRHGRAKVFELKLGFLKFFTDFTYDIRQVVLYVGKKKLRKFVGQRMAAKETGRHGRVYWMSAEKQLLLFHRFLNGNLVDDIFLSTVFHADISKPQLNVLIHNHALRICSTIHNVNLCYDTYRADSLWI